MDALGSTAPATLFQPAGGLGMLPKGCGHVFSFGQQGATETKVICPSPDVDKLSKQSLSIRPSGRWDPGERQALLFLFCRS